MNRTIPDFKGKRFRITRRSKPISGKTDPISEKTDEQARGSTLTLFDNHLKMLTVESGISQQIIEARQYRSIKTRAELMRLGFSDIQRSVPTMLVPIWDVTGEIGLYHHRPDTPRIREGKPAKYEFPAGSKMKVDVHPLIQEKVRDPEIPLFITEGVKKADAATSRGLCCIALIGTWNFRGTNEFGGLTALPDWEGIAFKGPNKKPREVTICYDSDVMVKKQVYQALVRLSAFLNQRGASVRYIYLPHGEDGKKCGLDDYLAAGHTTEELLSRQTTELRRPPAEETDEEQESACPYRETRNGLVWLKPTSNGPTNTPLSNFTARIVAQVSEDDGAEATRVFEVQATCNNRTTNFRVPAASFGAMNWPMEHLGAEAIVFPGFGLRDHLRTAIQVLSGKPNTRTVYKHTGWRQLETGEWAYLHAGGAITSFNATEPTDISVYLPDALKLYHLPEQTNTIGEVNAVNASLRLLDLGPDTLMFPLFASIWRACLGSADFSVYLAGGSGIFKSEAAALAQQHFGVGLDSRHLPASWEATENFIEGLAFAAKDALLVIDDFAPRGGLHDMQRLNAKADRVLRGQGNSSARGRLRADLTTRAQRPPRGLYLVTGEDIPPGHSLRARCLILEMGRGDIDKDRLTACQQDAIDGLYAQTTRTFVEWLAPQWDDWQAGRREQVTRLRTNAVGAGAHARTPEIVANLMIGLHYFLRFALEVGAISDVQRKALSARGWKALLSAAGAQEKHHAAANPVQRYQELLQAALASGGAHVATLNGGTPPNAMAWGWRKKEYGSDALNPLVGYQEQGKRIGWLEGENLYLNPEAAFEAANLMAREGGDRVTLSIRSLNTRLKEAGLLVTYEERRGAIIRQMCEGRRMNVLHLPADFLDGLSTPIVGETAQTAQTDQSEPKQVDVKHEQADNGQFAGVL